MTDEQQILVPDLEGDPETQRVHASVMAGLFGDENQVPKIDRYPILARVGQGAMGVVYACYDAQLDRRIAVKVLRADVESPSVRERMVREAQAMAKLSHPNVAHVYEVGEHDGRMFVAMEFVRGRTLREWVRTESRRWQEVLSVCVAAGHGLAAAHDHGLTHRDYKPDNIMVGDDGRVCVMDFGLVRLDAKSPVRESVEETTPGTSERELGLTRRGALIGTPAYMAPEQLRQADVGPAADQFAYCVTLWESLYGARPFAGESVSELAASVHSGELVEPPAASNVPGWIRRVLARGLAVTPADRFSTMADLLAALERGNARMRTWRVLAAIGTLAVFASGTEGWRRYERAHAIAACEAAGARIDEAWNDDVRAAVREAMVATGVSYAETTVEKVLPWIDAQATAWQYARSEACVDASVRAVSNEDTLNRSLWCLDERRMELEALVGELSRGDATVVQRAVTAAAGLSSVSACRDARLLERLPPPPAERREEVRAVRAELARADALERTAEYGEGLESARSAREQADVIGWPPLSSATLAREASLLERQGDYEAAERVGAKAYFVAARVGAWDVAADAATDLVFRLGGRGARHADALVWAEHAHVALAHAGDHEDLREARQLGNLAAVHFNTGDYAQARVEDERALAIMEKVLGADHPDIASRVGSLANIYYVTGERTRARTLNDRALAIREATLGPDHPDIASSLGNLGSQYYGEGKYAEAVSFFERALVIFERTLGPDHRDVAQALSNLSMARNAMGEHALALALAERALAIDERALGTDHPNVAISIGNVASVHYSTGAYAKARTLYERALAIKEKSLGLDHPGVAMTLMALAASLDGVGESAKARSASERALAIFEKALGPDDPSVGRCLIELSHLHYVEGEYTQASVLLERALPIYEKGLGPEHPEVARILANIADVRLATGDYTEARRLHERALAMREKAMGADDANVALSLSRLAEVHLASGDEQEAVRLFEQALLIYDHHDDLQMNELETRFAFAKVLVTSGGDRARALRLAEQARDGWRTNDEDEAKLAEVGRWLHRRE